MRTTRFPAAAALAALCAVPLAPAAFAPAAFAQEEKQKGDDDMTERLADAIVERLGDRFVDRLADRIADQIADRVAEQVADRLEAGANADEPPADMNSDEGVRWRLNELVKQSEPPARREAIENFLRGQWPEGEPLGEHAADLAGVLGFLARQLPEEAAYEAFALGGELAERALDAGDVAEETKESFGDVFYNAARAHARAEKYGEAFADLDRAFEFGYSDVEQLKEDEDLAGLRNLPGFAKRVDGWERAAREAAIAEARAALASGESFPLEFTYTDVEGEEHSLSDYAGQVVIVDFWGTWCPPCRAEIPSFIKLQKAYGKQGLQILGLNYGDEEEEAAEYAEENDVNYPTGLGADETREMVPEFRGYPTTVFVGRDGEVKLKVVGLHDYAFLDAVVSELLAQPAPKKVKRPKKKAAEQKRADADENENGADADDAE